MKDKIYCSLPMERYKLTDVGAIYNHNERQEGCYNNNNTLDESRRDLNYYLKKPEGYYLDVIRQKLKDYGIKERKNQNLMIEFVPSASRKWINALNADEQRKYLEYSYEFLVDKFGESNILSAVVHMDEGFPHLHVCIVPITKDGRLNTTDFIGGGREALINLLDEYYYHMVKEYPMVHRGIPFAKTHRRKIPLYLYRCIEDITEDHRQICSEIGDINLLNLSIQKTQILKDMQMYIEEIAKVKYMVVSTDEYIHNLESENEEKNQEICRLRKEKAETTVISADMIKICEQQKRDIEQLKEKNTLLDSIVSQLDLPTLSRLQRNVKAEKEFIGQNFTEMRPTKNKDSLTLS